MDQSDILLHACVSAKEPESTLRPADEFARSVLGVAVMSASKAKVEKAAALIHARDKAVAALFVPALKSVKACHICPAHVNVAIEALAAAEREGLL